MCPKCGVILLFLTIIINSVLSANILYVADVASPSHHIWNQALSFGLVKRGHNVTHITPDENKAHKPKNYTHIVIDGIYDEQNDHFDINAMAFNGPLTMLLDFKEWCVHHCNLTLKSQGLQKLLQYPSDFKFDLIIFDITCGPCLYPLMQRFNYPPSIGVTAFLLPTYASYNFGNHLIPSYIPWYGLQHTTDMTFSHRILNYIFTYLCALVRNTLVFWEEHALATEVFGQNIPTMAEFEKHISLLLANSDPILDYPQPVPPNIIPVGGLHTRKSNNIPQDLQKILDNAKDGAIIFSLGTNVRSDKLDKKMQNEILDAFSKIKQTVIWKFESAIDNLPKNVIVRKWLPQNDLLGHPNVKLFIGHGGALSTQEAIFHGIPMVAVPFIVDQHVNTRILVKKKLGVSVDFTRITSNYFLGKIKEVLDNPSYYDNMKKIAKLYNDRPETALERGIFWVEYVIRNGGADFLNTPARLMPFYKSSGLDVLAFLLAITFIIILLVCKVIKFFLKFFSKAEKVKRH